MNEIIQLYMKRSWSSQQGYRNDSKYLSSSASSPGIFHKAEKNAVEIQKSVLDTIVFEP